MRRESYPSLDALLVLVGKLLSTVNDYLVVIKGLETHVRCRQCDGCADKYKERDNLGEISSNALSSQSACTPTSLFFFATLEKFSNISGRRSFQGISTAVEASQGGVGARGRTPF